MHQAALRVFLSPPDFLGFGSVDYVLASLAGLLCLGLAALHRFPQQERQALGIGNLSRFHILTCLVASLPAVLRLWLLPRHPVPVGSGADDFSYLLLADTLAHGHFANPPAPFPDFFEQIFVLQSPTHSSIYPLGQGLMLAAGQRLFGLPWAGVLIVSALFIATLIWALRTLVGDRWALLGGLIAVAQFGPLCYWMNCYWGGYLSATAGCLVIGALPRLSQSTRLRYLVPLGLGLAIQLLTRPFEFLLMSFCVAGYLGWLLRRNAWLRTRWRSGLILLCGMLAPAIVLMMLQNMSVTGSLWTLPYAAYRHQYGVPATFTFQRNPLPSRMLNEEQQQDYQAECAIHGEGRDTMTTYGSRLGNRVRFVRFFLPPACYGLFLFGLFVPNRRRLLLLLGSLAIFIAGSNFYPYFYPHYLAAVTPLVLLVPLLALKRMLNKPGTKRFILSRCLVAPLITLTLAPFAFWYGLHLQDPSPWRDHLLSFETWDFLNGPDPQGRATVTKHLTSASGKQLVFVQYSPGHAFAEWVHNGADIENARVIYVHDEGSAANESLEAHYSDRQAWLLQPDFDPPRLTPLQRSSSPFKDVP